MHTHRLAVPLMRFMSGRVGECIGSKKCVWVMFEFSVIIMTPTPNLVKSRERERERERKWERVWRGIEREKKRRNLGDINEER